METNDFDLIQHCMEDLYLSRMEFPRRFYERLFNYAPEIRPLFTTDRNRQNLMLYAVMTMAVSCMRSGKDPCAELREFGERHLRAGVTEEMFPVFGRAFVETMVEFLPHRDADALAAAWYAIYGRISEGVITGMREAASRTSPFGRARALRAAS